MNNAEALAEDSRKIWFKGIYDEVNTFGDGAYVSALKWDRLSVWALNFLSKPTAGNKWTYLELVLNYVLNVVNTLSYHLTVFIIQSYKSIYLLVCCKK